MLERRHVVGLAAVGASQRPEVADQETAGAVGEEHPLVRIEGDGVGELDSRERLAPAGGQREEAAVGCVDVHPQAVLAGDPGDLRERIDGAGVRRAAARDDQKGAPAGRPVLAQGGLERLGEHPEPRVARDDPQGAAGSPATAAALVTEWWTWSETYIVPSRNSSPRRSERAATSADRLASDPPVVRRPPAPSPRPIIRQSHRSTLSSSCTSPGAASQTPV